MMWGGVEARAFLRSSPMEIVDGSTSPSQLEEVVEAVVEETEGHLAQVGQFAVDACE